MAVLIVPAGIVVQHEDGTVTGVPTKLSIEGNTTTFKAEIPGDEPFIITGEFSEQIQEKGAEK